VSPDPIPRDSIPQEPDAVKEPKIANPLDIFSKFTASDSVPCSHKSHNGHAARCFFLHSTRKVLEPGNVSRGDTSTHNHTMFLRVCNPHVRSNFNYGTAYPCTLIEIYAAPTTSLSRYVPHNAALVRPAPQGGGNVVFGETYKFYHERPLSRSLNGLFSIPHSDSSGFAATRILDISTDNHLSPTLVQTTPIYHRIW